MSGLLIDDAERIRCMEPDGKGIYIPAKLKVGTSGASELITGKNDVYLSESAFHALYRYVMETLKQTAQQIYQGDIAANPLILPKKRSANIAIIRIFAEIFSNSPAGQRNRMHRKPCWNN